MCVCVYVCICACMPMCVCMFIRSLPSPYNYSNTLLSYQVLLFHYKVMTCISVTVQMRKPNLGLEEALSNILLLTL